MGKAANNNRGIVVEHGVMPDGDGEQVHDDKKWLCAYPVFLFYVFMAWYAIVA